MLKVLTMGKITVTLLIVAISLTGFPSCKKDYTCTCTTSSGIVYDSKIKTTKKKAKSFCSDQETSTKACTLQ
jgi:hypothetical protein